MRLRDDGAQVLMPQNADQGKPTWNSSDPFAGGAESPPTGAATGRTRRTSAAN